MTYEIILGLITIAGAVIAIGKIISNNTKVLVRLECSIDKLTETLGETKGNVEEIDNQVKDHEKRLIIIEHEKNR